MNKPGVLVVAGDREQGHEVCSLLQELEYAATLIHSLKAWNRSLKRIPRSP